MKLVYVQGIYAGNLPPKSYAETEGFNRKSTINLNRTMINTEHILSISAVVNGLNAAGEPTGYDVIVSTAEIDYYFCKTAGTNIDGLKVFERLSTALVGQKWYEIITAQPYPELQKYGTYIRYMWGEDGELQKSM